jgi:predicted metal-dependent hydrolase
MKKTTDSVLYGKTQIEYTVRFSKSKTLVIEVKPDQSITVKAPEGLPLQAIQQKILKRGKWIKKQQRFFEPFQQRVPERQYIGGETHLFLGRCFPLRGQVTLNIHLIKAPQDCIEQVAMHEFCHLIQADHSSAFYNLLTKKFPNWKKVKHKLETFISTGNCT